MITAAAGNKPPNDPCVPSTVGSRTGSIRFRSPASLQTSDDGARASSGTMSARRRLAFVAMLVIGGLAPLIEAGPVLFRRAPGRHPRRAARRTKLAGAVDMPPGTELVFMVAHGAGAAHASSRRCRTLIDEQTITPRLLQSRALAGASACLAPVLRLLPERFRRPHRHQGLAGRAGDRRPDRKLHRGRLVHASSIPITTLALVGTARSGRLAGAGGAVDRAASPSLARHLPAVDPQVCRGDRRGGLDDQRPHRRLLLQHADAEAVRGQTATTATSATASSIYLDAHAAVHAQADRRCASR